MKKITLLLGIICLFFFFGCSQEEKTEQPTRNDIQETGEGVKEKGGETTEPVNEKAEEAIEAAEKESRETAENLEKDAGNADEVITEKAGETENAGLSGVIEMKNEKAFPQHRMGIIQFDHEKHEADKPKGYGLGCGECHHDENGEPLGNLVHGDEVQSCYECHDKNGTPRRDPSMSQEEWRKEQLAYYYGAIHENCTQCHKKMGGPVSCTQCHPRPQQ